ECADAIRCWREVLSIDPQQAVARDYLEAAGVPSEPVKQAEIIDLGAARAQLINDETLAAADSWDAEVFGADGQLARQRLEVLLQEKRYEEALRLLYLARARKPDDTGIARGIQLLRERLILAYSAELGNQDIVPLLAIGVDVASRTTEERQ